MMPLNSEECSSQNVANVSKFLHSNLACPLSVNILRLMHQKDIHLPLTYVKVYPQTEYGFLFDTILCSRNASLGI